jgi:hypothetical protein
MLRDYLLLVARADLYRFEKTGRNSDATELSNAGGRPLDRIIGNISSSIPYFGVK